MTELASEVASEHATRDRNVRMAVLTVVGAGLAAAFVVSVLTITHGDGGVAGVLAAALRFVRYTGTLLAVGGFVFAAFVTPPSSGDDPRVRRVAVVAGCAAALAVVVSLPVQAGYLTGDLGAIVDPTALDAVGTSGFGTSAIVGLAGLALVVAAVARPVSVVRLGLGAAGAALALGAFLLTGHSVASQPQALALTGNLVHTLAGAVWLGGLVSLPIALTGRKRAQDATAAADLVSRFSSTAMAAVAAVAAGGGALAWVEVRSLSALSTPYGLTLAVKVALVVAVVAVGAYNNRRLVPAVRAAGDRGWHLLSRLVRLEALGLVAVLAVTAVLVNVVPARVEAGIDAQAVRIAEMGPDYTMTLQVQPARPGSNELHLYIEHDQRLLGQGASEVTVTFLPPDTEAPVLIEPAQVGPGHWLHLGREMDRNGSWTVEVDATVDGERRSVTVQVPIASVGQ